MAKIKITKGAVSVATKGKSGVTRFAVKTPGDGMFECDDTQAKRLVDRGVALYAEEKPKKPARRKKEEAPVFEAVEPV